MKKITFLLLSACQLIIAANNDSLFYFKNSYKIPLYYNAILCDGCGCATSGGAMGFASMLNSNFVGIRYFNQGYRSNDGLYSNSVWYNERFNTTQIWARIPVVKNIQISALLPYHSHNRKTATGLQTIGGLGDITIIAMYNVLKKSEEIPFFEQTLQLGGGLKAPTGTFDQSIAGSTNPSFQVGTGSWDYLLAAEHVIKRKAFGLNTMFNYVMKTENSKQYRFGNQLNYASTLFYVYEKNTLSIVPQVGFAGEVYADNYQFSQIVRNTAGDVFFSKIGVEIGKKKLSAGANVMLPITQNLVGGRVEAQYRWSVNLNYSL